MTRFPIRALVAGAAAAVAALAFSLPADAQTANAMVRAAHFSPDAPAVDIYVNNEKTLSNVEFKQVSDYLEVPAGDYTIDVRAAGSAADSAAVLSAPVTVEGGKAYTVAAVDTLAEIKAQVYNDDLAAPPAGQVKLRVIHAAPEVPAVDVGVKGQTPEQALVKNLSFPDGTDYLVVPAGTYDLEVRPAGTADVAVAVNGLALEAGTVYTAAAVGLGADVTVLPVVDAASGSTMPSGGVATGLGGTAGDESGSSLPWLAAFAILGLAGLGTGSLVLARRSAQR